MVGMADPRTLTPVNGARRVAGSPEGQETAPAADEAKRLRKENTLLAGRVKRREERIDHLDKKVARLEKDNKQLQRKWDIHTHAAFKTQLCEHSEDYQNIFDDPLGQSDFSSLASWSKYFPPSNVQPITLHPDQWHLSKILDETKDEDKHELDTEMEDTGVAQAIWDGKQESIESISSRNEVDETKAYNGENGNHTDDKDSHRLDGQKYEPTTPTQPMSFRPDEAKQGSMEHISKDNEFIKQDRQQQKPVIPSQPRFFRPDEEAVPEGAEHSIDTRDRKRPRHSTVLPPPGYRKSICVRCWTTRAFCSFDPQCENCVTADVKCVRKLCDDGEKCFNRRCPYLHPGEWNETNTEYVVEGGKLPTPGGYRPGDYYRPN